MSTPHYETVSYGRKTSTKCTAGTFVAQEADWTSYTEDGRKTDIRRRLEIEVRGDFELNGRESPGVLRRSLKKDEILALRSALWEVHQSLSPEPQRSPWPKNTELRWPAGSEITACGVISAKDQASFWLEFRATREGNVVVHFTEETAFKELSDMLGYFLNAPEPQIQFKPR